MKGNWTVLDAMRYARHDWMNQLQLLKGNMALQKWDRVEGIMDDLIVQAQQDSRLTNLGKAKFAERMLTFNWENHAFQIEWEILEEGYRLSIEDDVLVHTFNEWLTYIDERAKPYEDNVLMIRLQKVEEQMVFSFEYSGVWQEDLARRLQRLEESAVFSVKTVVEEQRADYFFVKWHVT